VAVRPPLAEQALRGEAVTAALYNHWGRKLCEQRVVDSFGALRLAGLYSSWEYIIVVATNGRPCEMFVRR